MFIMPSQKTSLENKKSPNQVAQKSAYVLPLDDEEEIVNAVPFTMAENSYSDSRGKAASFAAKSRSRVSRRSNLSQRLQEQRDRSKSSVKDVLRSDDHLPPFSPAAEEIDDQIEDNYDNATYDQVNSSDQQVLAANHLPMEQEQNEEMIISQPKMDAYTAREERPIKVSHQNNYDANNLGILMESPPFRRAATNADAEQNRDISNPSSGAKRTFLKRSGAKQTKSFLLLQKWQAQKKEEKSQKSSLAYSISQPSLQAGISGK